MTQDLLALAEWLEQWGVTHVAMESTGVYWKPLFNGSGGIKSANKFISHVRLKRSGAWWYVERANVMLVLRCAKYNGTFERVFERYKQGAMRGQGLPPS